MTKTEEQNSLPTAAGESLADLSRILYTRGWMPGTSGNLSVRLSGNHASTALITASGRDKGELTAKDMVAVHATTGEEVLLPGRLKASAETSIHTAVYRRTDAAAVVHVHSPYSTVMACRAAEAGRTTALLLERFELLKGLGLDDPARTELPVFRNWSDVRLIADEVATYLASHPGAPPGLLIADHGITTWGRDLAQARNRLECIEAICQLLVLGAREGRAETTEELYQ
ncbi:methylthioribulose 1-phosphate dehydratase [Streptomyces sp. DSM 42041]|uniref:Methylthioribulose-1-phosphate dehydratase n=1 Tax=Streptomyces hazeniae TaxID=3075538 RepID=A0ABU2P104_9ACTN|nr:methylthioribulose 1-phosphate dehydratase [Streptomyces sp. DSM 42041]MDT0382148.1 methylthioribulose 1-phosphate dehydratase [Streptomyces sp. DSM 42041]